jgi:carbon monoxide dehydrogenase subunit G
MELVGEQIINAARPRVWAAINDPEILSRCIPGCEEVSQLSPTESNARVMLKVGPVRARFSGRILMSDIVAPSECRISFEGAGGAAGFAKGQSEVTLIDEGPRTRLRYTVSASVGGKLGQIGGRLIDASARKVADEFFTALDSALDDREVAAEGATVAPLHPHREDAAQAPLFVPRTSASPPPVGKGAGFSNGIAGEMSRAFWFCLGVAVTLLVTHLSR